ncbi:response regulator transcription factor [Aquabacterium sp. OR-4]|uniref:response regulator transcription factor n=1 Tax=Aquabacterium sp. OR-4 TaxID=2978127 RepID=UPI0021B330E3|nr:response regulator transcription factor [Aquabacterium sp. OR-4]MDT7836318.1 response regulator transcription factor [Aquabacterium sp. OR-4]
MHRILLIDDDAELGPPLAAYLQRFDLQLEAALTPSAGQARLAQGGIAAVILDVMLPEMDGFVLCRLLRADSDIPILMLTARGDLTDRVVGLELGADDYLPKPFEPRELAARLQTILRRARPVAPPAPATAPPADAVLHFDGLLIDTARREVRRLGAPVPLTGTEYELLLVLAREPQRVFHRDEILNRLRGREADLATRAVDILVSRLRRKLEPLAVVKTLRNAGYALALAPGDGPAAGSRDRDPLTP